MKFSNTIKTVLKIYQKYVINSVWFGTGSSSKEELKKEGDKQMRKQRIMNVQMTFIVHLVSRCEIMSSI